MGWEEVVDLYCSAWDEADPDRRRTILEPIWAEGATYTDPTVHLAGLAALVEHIGRVAQRYPGSRIVRTSAVDAHHAVARFGWQKVLADGTALPEGIDFVERNQAGTIARVVGFFGPLRPAEGRAIAP